MPDYREQGVRVGNEGHGPGTKLPPDVLRAHYAVSGTLIVVYGYTLYRVRVMMVLLGGGMRVCNGDIECVCAMWGTERGYAGSRPQWESCSGRATCASQARGGTRAEKDSRSRRRGKSRGGRAEGRGSRSRKGGGKREKERTGVVQR
eukprot:403167-Rhodomonas_salina.4